VTGRVVADDALVRDLAETFEGLRAAAQTSKRRS
jgi:hypothetical protein